MSFEPPVAEQAPAGLSDAQCRFYQREGYLVLRGVFQTAEMQALARDAKRVCESLVKSIDAHNLRVRFQPHCETGLPVFEVLDPIADLSPVAQAITVDPRIRRPLHDLYGEPAELFKDKLIYKPPGASGAPLHQDWIAWPRFPESFLTVLVAIDPFTSTNGATEVFPRLHHRGSLSPQDGRFHILDRDTLSIDPVSLLLDVGDVAMFSGYTPHFSGPNREASSRRGYFISYNARSNGGNQYQSHYREYHAWVRARTPEPLRSLLFFR